MRGVETADTCARTGRRACGLAVLLIAVLAALCVPAAPAKLEAQEAAPQPVPISPDADWRTTVNYYREMAGLPGVSENAAWSDGAAKHARYVVKTGVSGHSEDPASTWYTAEGDAAARNGNVAGDSAILTDRQIIEGWMRAPFHALSILDPKLQSSGFGGYRDSASTTAYRLGATLDVMRGLTGARNSTPVAWPADGTTVPLTSYSGNERPSPVASCAGYTSTAGLPLIVQLPESPVKVNVALVDGSGAPVEVCTFDSSTYANPDAGQQQTGRAILDARDAVVIIPRNPLQDRQTYAVRVRTCARDVSWSFGTDRAGSSYVPVSVPAPAVGAPSGCPAPPPPPGDGGGSVTAPPNTAPTVRITSPRKTTSDATPKITATIRDAQTNLLGRNVKLYLDGKRITRFSYSSAKDRLTYTSRKLKPGKHTAKIVATDAAGRSASKSWRFAVRR